jgi:hypothetical protein
MPLRDENTVQIRVSMQTLVLLDVPIGYGFETLGRSL